MGKPGAALGHWTILLGIAIGLAGLVLAALAYPLYNRILKKEREDCSMPYYSSYMTKKTENDSDLNYFSSC